MAEQNRQIEGVVVEIFGQDYKIGGDPGDVQRVAEYVDRKMREIAEGHQPRLPTTQVAILAAMDITAEFFRVMTERKEFTDKAHDSIDKLTRLVEERAKIPSSPNADHAAPRDRSLRQSLGALDSATTA